MKFLAVVIFFALLTFSSFFAFSSESPKQFIVDVKLEFKSGKQGFFIHARPKGAADVFVPTYMPRYRFSNVPEPFVLKAKLLKQGEKVREGHFCLRGPKKNSLERSYYEVAKEDFEAFLYFVESWTRVLRSNPSPAKKLTHGDYFLWALRSLKAQADLRAKLAILNFKKKVLPIFTPPFSGAFFEPKKFFLEQGFYVRGAIPAQRIIFSEEEKSLLKKHVRLRLELKKKVEELFLNFEKGESVTFSELVREISFLIENASKTFRKKQGKAVSASEPFELLEVGKKSEADEEGFVNLGSKGSSPQEKEWEEV